MNNSNKKRKFIKIKDFLLRKRNREFLIFLFFFALSSVFWLLQALNETFKSEVSIPIELQHVPSNLIITSDLPEALTVTVEDKGSVLLRYMYAQTFNPVIVDFRNYSTLGLTGRVQIQESDVRKNVVSQLFASTKVVSMKPDTLEFFYNRGLKKTVPVRMAGGIETAVPYFLRGIHCKPDSVVVYAPASVLDTLRAAYANAGFVSSLKENAEMVLPLTNVRGAKFIPDTVRVQLDVDLYTEKTVEVPIVGINFPADKDLRTFPSKARVTFKVGTKSYKAVNAEDFAIVITYEELMNNEQAKFPLRLKRVPEGVSSVRIQPTEVEYLLEQTRSLQDD